MPVVWVALKITERKTREVHYRSLVGWSDHKWDLVNIENVKPKSRTYHITADKLGNITYSCNRKMERFNVCTQNIFGMLKRQWNTFKVEQVPIEEVIKCTRSLKTVKS